MPPEFKAQLVLALLEHKAFRERLELWEQLELQAIKALLEQALLVRKALRVRKAHKVLLVLAVLLGLVAHKERLESKGYRGPPELLVLLGLVLLGRKGFRERREFREQLVFRE